MVVAILIGTVLGFLSGLGTGGGSMLILWLTLVVNMEQAQARLVNLMFFLPSAIVACLFRWKQGHLQIKKVLPAIFAGSLSAGLFANWSSDWDTAMLQKCFGMLLILAGLREVFYKKKITSSEN